MRTMLRVYTHTHAIRRATDRLTERAFVCVFGELENEIRMVRYDVVARGSEKTK